MISVHWVDLYNLAVGAHRPDILNQAINHLSSTIGENPTKAETYLIHVLNDLQTSMERNDKLTARVSNMRGALHDLQERIEEEIETLNQRIENE